MSYVCILNQSKQSYFKTCRRLDSKSTEFSEVFQQAYGNLGLFGSDARAPPDIRAEINADDMSEA